MLGLVADSIDGCAKPCASCGVGVDCWTRIAGLAKLVLVLYALGMYELSEGLDCR